MVILWPESIKFTKPLKGFTDIVSWFDWDGEAYNLNDEQVNNSSIFVMKFIEKEVQLLDNDYKRLFFGGFSAGAIVYFSILLLHLQRPVGGFFAHSAFPSPTFIENVSQLSENDNQEFFEKVRTLKDMPIFEWHGD